jgi:hypothetical protein
MVGDEGLQDVELDRAKLKHPKYLAGFMPIIGFWDRF